ncbi:hypothetical protein [Jatrophihabitans fulvus]
MADRRALRTGPGRVLVFFYGVLAVAATGRASFELVTKYSDAPLAYVLSAVAAVIYVVAFVALLGGARPLAWVACGIELVGVLVVGTLSWTVRRDFPDTTVWSGYGSGYGFLPAVLPVLALVWLARAPRGR